MTSEWMANAQMREWACQSLPRSRERGKSVKYELTVVQLVRREVTWSVEAEDQDSAEDKYLAGEARYLDHEDYGVEDCWIEKVEEYRGEQA